MIASRSFDGAVPPKKDDEGTLVRLAVQEGYIISRVDGPDLPQMWRRHEGKSIEQLVKDKDWTPIGVQL